MFALVLSAVWLFWPLALGGGTTYLATYGDSMEPGFQAGDLAILRTADRYAVGDVVAYRSPSLNTVVMHRVVSADVAGFVTQGDNNDWLDQDKPSRDEILGRLFLRIPRGGIALDAITSPGALVFVVCGLLAVAGNARRHPVRRHLRAARRRVARRTAAYSMPTRSVARQAALGAGAVALVALVGGGVLLVLPSTQTDARTLQVTQQGQFSYTGAAEPGTTYPSGVIETGDTVWTKLARQVTASFTHTVMGPELTELQGSLRLDVSVTAADGWTAVVTQGPVAALESGAGTATVTVEPSAAAALLSRHYAEIGGVGGGSSLTVTPVVELTGRAEGRRFTAGSPAGLSFALDAASLAPVGAAETDLAPITKTEVAIDEVVPRTIPVLDFQVPIDTARLVAAVLFAVALLVLGAGAWIGQSRRGDAADRFLVRHADRILPVAAFSPGPTVFDVADAESLHRVAERFDTVVLHHAAEDEDVFVVRDADATYRFVVPGAQGRHRGKPPVPAPVSAPVPAPASVSQPVDSTWPLPRIDPVPPDLTSPLPLIAAPRHGRHWSRVA
ncbi:signal peptidase I [Blastococcus sp. CT_GayMR19]|uniref:signal peptidase I n=1 Tax=Blastococcus sp. CT_GayMR19 TaxID=2559608 RepID=UPI00142FD2F3|nr:signal peptidase I [Blastococcus sp. CT_GayMR19]